MRSGPISLLLVDHHRMIREGIQVMVGIDLQVVGAVDCAAEATEVAARCRPDVALIGLDLPDGGGIELIRVLHHDHPNLRIVALSPIADDRTFFEAVVAGAVGYLVEDIEADALVDALCLVAGGASLISPEVIDDLRARRRQLPADSELIRALTGQERRILAMVVDGATNNEIAIRLGLAEKTVRNYMSNILGKAGARNRTELTANVVRASAVASPGAAERPSRNGGRHAPSHNASTVPRTIDIAAAEQVRQLGIPSRSGSRKVIL